MIITKIVYLIDTNWVQKKYKRNLIIIYCKLSKEPPYSCIPYALGLMIALHNNDLLLPECAE